MLRFEQEAAKVNSKESLDGAPKPGHRSIPCKSFTAEPVDNSIEIYYNPTCKTRDKIHQPAIDRVCDDST